MESPLLARLALMDCVDIAVHPTAGPEAGPVLMDSFIVISIFGFVRVVGASQFGEPYSMWA